MAVSSIGKNFIVAGAVLGIGAAAAGFYILSSQQNETIDTNIRGEGSVASYSAKVKAVYDDAVRDVVIADVAPANTWVARDKARGADGKLVKTADGKVPRYTPLFFAPKLWLVDNGTETPEMVDLLVIENPEKPDVKSRVHSEVPNDWFFFYGLDDIIGARDALNLDSDGDGFTNAEEFASKTDPSDKTSHPSFIVGDSAKIVCTARHTSSHTIELSTMSDFSNPAAPSIYISLYEGKTTSGQPRKEKKKVGDTFGFSDAAGKGLNAKDRFKILSVGKDAQGDYVEIEDTFVAIEENKKFSLHMGSSNAHRINDSEATLLLTAGSEKGKELDHNIQLGESFSVPGFPGVTCTLVQNKKTDIRIKSGEQEIKIDLVPPAQNEKK